MDYPNPVTVHFYQFETLHSALNYLNMCQANLPEIRSQTVHTSRELELLVDKTCSSHVCVMVETGGTRITAGIPSGQECAARANRYFLDQQNRKNK